MRRTLERKNVKYFTETLFIAYLHMSGMKRVLRKLQQNLKRCKTYFKVLGIVATPVVF